MYTGPHIIKDGLVFGYDTGYGIADPGLSTRFYKGKPTTNIASGAAFIHDTSGGSAGSCVDAPEKGPGWKKVTITAIGTNFRVVQFGSYPSLTANITYSSSFEVDWGNMRGKGYSLTQDGSGGGTRNYFINGSYASGVTGSSINSSLLDGHIGMNIVKTANHVHVPFIYNYGSTSTTGRNDYFYYKEYQQEVGTIPTPYVDGTRSDTASLIDLKETTDINISNVSFDSTGQPDFDGSDDYASLGNPTVLRDLTSGTIETVYKRDVSTSTYQMVFTDAGSDLEITYFSNALQFYIGNSGLSYTHAVTGQYFHVVGTWGSGTKKLYINGVEVASGTNTGIDTGNRDRYVGGRGTSFPFNGKIPIVKVLTRALTATEIKQNFNAYKNRFDI